MSKKHIIIAGIGGILSFAMFFTTALFLGRPAAPQTNTHPQGTATGEQASQTAAATGNAPVRTDDEATIARGLSEKQLKSLIYEVREKIKEYESKMKELETREARLAVTQDTLRKDVDELNKMRVELASLVANLKEQRSRLLETRAEIENSEKANLAVIAATYDKMDPASASKIISSMCEKQLESGRAQGGPIDDAVKILYFMNDRTKAKLLAEMVSMQPKLAAVLCQRSKEIIEQK